MWYLSLIAGLELSKTSFYFTVSRVSPGRFPPPRSLAPALNQHWSPRWWVSQDRWFAGCVGTFTRRCQGETPGGLGLPRHCSPSVAWYTQRPVLLTICMLQSDSGLSPSQSCQTEPGREGVACLWTTLCPWALKKATAASFIATLSGAVIFPLGMWH